jgi:hypothetical protein
MVQKKLALKKKNEKTLANLVKQIAPAAPATDLESPERLDSLRQNMESIARTFRLPY